ncbi:MAG: class I SAM-dependent methyltransferase [Methylovirgula sp.]
MAIEHKNLEEDLRAIGDELRQMRSQVKVLTKYMQEFRSVLPDVLWGTLEGFSHDLETQRAAAASWHSAELSLRTMNMAKSFMGSRALGFGFDREASFKLLEFALANTKIKDGLYLEFGVHQGTSIGFIAERYDGMIHGFDSFEGLPEDWKSDGLKGAFDLGGVLPKVPDNVVLHKGWFADTLPSFLEGNPGKVGFLNIDCDLYSSTKFVLESLADRFDVGTIVHFDEYFNYPGWEQHEYRAWQEFTKTNGIEYEYIGFTATAYAVAVRITKLKN